MRFNKFYSWLLKQNLDKHTPSGLQSLFLSIFWVINTPFAIPMTNKSVLLRILIEVFGRCKTLLIFLFRDSSALNFSEAFTLSKFRFSISIFEKLSNGLLDHLHGKTIKSHDGTILDILHWISFSSTFFTWRFNEKIWGVKCL